MGRREGRHPQMELLFGENVCQNERIGSRWGWGDGTRPPPGYATVSLCLSFILCNKQVYLNKIIYDMIRHSNRRV